MTFSHTMQIYFFLQFWACFWQLYVYISQLWINSKKFQAFFLRIESFISIFSNLDYIIWYKFRITKYKLTVFSNQVRIACHILHFWIIILKLSFSELWGGGIWIVKKKKKIKFKFYCISWWKWASIASCVHCIGGLSVKRNCCYILDIQNTLPYCAQFT